MKFSIRDILWLTLVAAIVLGFLYARPTRVGRFQMELDQKLQRTYLLDTTNGRVWYLDVQGNWSPASMPSDLK